jgi:hypothetical protein
MFGKYLDIPGQGYNTCRRSYFAAFLHVQSTLADFLILTLLVGLYSSSIALGGAIT